jgi:hypothetical protein
MLADMSAQPDEPKDQRVPVMMSVSELKEIKDWRRSQEALPSRSEAVRQLVALGLANSASLKADQMLRKGRKR